MRAQAELNLLVVDFRQVYPLPSTNLMRRFAANSIVVALLALFLTPAMLLGDSQKLCCRRAAMHHCEGTSGAAPDQSGTSFNNNGAKCPMSCCASTAHAKFGAPKFHTAIYHGHATHVAAPHRVALHSERGASNLRDRSPPLFS